LVEERARDLFLAGCPEHVLATLTLIDPPTEFYFTQMVLELCVRCKFEMSFSDTLKQVLGADALLALKDVMFGTHFRIAP
jgi:hypothetical protein